MTFVRTCRNCRLRRTRRFLEEYGLPEYDAAVLTAAKDVADYFEACVKLFHSPKRSAIG